MTEKFNDKKQGQNSSSVPCGNSMKTSARTRTWTIGAKNILLVNGE
jgi:hypothetical protein